MSCKEDVRQILDKRRFAVERIRDELLSKLTSWSATSWHSVMQEINDQIAASEGPADAAPVLPPSTAPKVPGPPGL